MRNKVEILLLDKGYLDKQLSQLPGVPGAKQELPGVPIKESDDNDEDDVEDGDECFCTKCGNKVKKVKHDEPDADDAGGQSDDDEDNMSAAGIPKKERSFFKMLVNKLFNGGNTTTQMEYSPLYSEKDGVSIIDISGEIGKRLSQEEKQMGKVDVDDITKAVKMAAVSDTKACILHINSPGGCSTGVEETGNIIKKLTERKPVFTYCDTICASAGYWLASCTNGIFVTPSSEIGSIGVYAKVVDISENLKMQGINMQIFSAGTMKTMGQPDLPLTEEEAKYIQADVDEQWGKFKALVTEARGPVKEEYMQGQLMGGEKAIEANLADELVSDIETVITQVNK